MGPPNRIAALRLGELLRGIGLTDPPDVRVQYALLRAFGVSAQKTRALIAAKPGQVAEVLLRACHLRATDPGAVNKSWAGWIIHHVEQDTSFAGEVAFQRWRRTGRCRRCTGRNARCVVDVRRDRDRSA